ncbi:hypothetical protein [Candidatus Hakubella thermalkaliphila]|uniref:hypothetical protein n=1 Tax=Candidatus Hakubella thermalkaliphila TaxID=2754717 RepID=UPI001C616358|nr:hypothetical protein [Candidatus Hakubella thermalkaliphila]
MSELMDQHPEASPGVSEARSGFFAAEFIHEIGPEGHRTVDGWNWRARERSRRQKGILAFLAQDAATRVFCYTNADVRKETQNDEILRFVEFWKQRTGRLPEELIFDSKLTTYKNLNVLNQQGIAFITLRRRSLKMLREVHQEPASAWRRIELHGVSRIHKTPRIIDRKVTLKTMKAPFVR